MSATLENKNADKLSYLAPATFLFAGLMPEYVAPFFTVIGFILVLRNRIKNKIFSQSKNLSGKTVEKETLVIIIIIPQALNSF